MKIKFIKIYKNNLFLCKINYYEIKCLNFIKCHFKIFMINKFNEKN